MTVISSIDQSYRDAIHPQYNTGRVKQHKSTRTQPQAHMEEAAQRCGTLKLASARFNILNKPSPRIKPLARIIIGVSVSFLQDLQYQFTNPPIVLANVNEGVLYMPAPRVSNPPSRQSKCQSKENG